MEKILLKVRVDHREFKDIFQWLKAVGADVERSTLLLGDIDTDKVCIEFKRLRDFLDSTFNRRIDSQLARMAEEERYCVLLIAGSYFELSPRQKARLKYGEKGIWGAIGSLSYRYGVNIIWIDHPVKFENDGIKKAMYVAHKICTGVSEGKIGKPRYKYSKVRSLPTGVGAIKKAYGVPTNVAQALHKKFKNLGKIATATKSELKSVRGVGESRAEQIYKISRA